MKLRSASGLIALCSGLAVALVAVVDLGRKSPGPLTSVHGREGDLAGRSGCADCHGGWLGNMTDSCLECHTVIDEQIEQQAGLHGALGSERASHCAPCHSEHHGANFPIVNRQSFAMAGVPNIEDFDHRRVGFEMDGAHLELACAECHVNARTMVLPKGAQRYGGLDQDCASCHEDVHEGRLAALACASCHGQQAWSELHSLGHEKQLPLVGGHADLDCRGCHADQDAHSLEALANPRLRPAARDCAACHASPHAAPFANGVAALLEQPLGASCVGCHAAEHTSFRDERLALGAEQHAPSGFALEAPHEGLTCAQCHDPEGASFAARYPGREADTCSACHADPHGGQFARGPFAQGDCIACHERAAFAPHAFDETKHALAALPLEGAHREVGCNDCHELPAPEEPRTFRGTPARCEQCHSDAHRGFFAPIAAELAPEKRGECARCHDATSFSTLPAAGFDHAWWTDFPVHGAHAQEECAACHPARAEPDDTGRSFGRVEEHFGAFTGCVTCHADPHAGLFDAPGLPLEVAGRAGCERCHVDSSFRVLPNGFAHGQFTGYVLAGAHAQAECAACHEPRARAGADGRTWERAAGRECSDCHIDAHAGQFALAGENDCARCHDETRERFLDFDHERDSRFKLGVAHAEVECAACHLPYRQGGREVTRYKPLGVTCADCHGAYEDVLSRRKPRRK